MVDASDRFSLGPVELKNRLLLAPLKTALNAPMGKATLMGEAFYARIARGGVALVTLEPAAVSADGVEHPKQLRIHSDEHVAELQRLVTVVHDANLPVMIHLNHAGRAANPKVIGGPPVAPVAMPCPTTGAEARALATDRIEAIIDEFSAAAARAADAGADLIELQMGHGYLISQFLSARTNTREDGWGGDAQARLAFARRVLEGVVAAVAKIPVVARISGKEFVEQGLQPSDLGGLFELMSLVGVAAVHVGFGNACDSPPWYFNHMAMPMQAQDEVSRSIRSMTDLPLIAVGRMGDPARLRSVLADGLADLVALGRPLVADPDFPNKLLGRHEDRIFPCGACLQGCLTNVKSNRPISCLVNPWTHTNELEPAARPKKVLVIGAGPAGIGAAIAAAGRGHPTTVVERRERVGGQFRMAVRARGKEMMTRVLDGLERRLELSGAIVRTGASVEPDLLRSVAPDVVILASGSNPRKLEIDHIEEQHVITSFGYLDGSQEVRGRRVLVIGAGMVGMEVAELLTEQGLEVVATKRSDTIAADMDPVSRALMLKRLEVNDKLTVMPNTTVTAFEAGGVRVVRGEGEMLLPPVGTVVLCAGMEPELSLLAVLDEVGVEVRVVGDASTPSNIEAAFHEGWSVGAVV